LSKSGLESWLETVQKQPIEELANEEYTFQQFLELIWVNNGFEVARSARPEDKDISKSISNYFISSSHNTYLSGNQLSSKSSTEAYKNVKGSINSTGYFLATTNGV
jgi:phosphatidylinositol phospholipase C delta